MSVVDGQQRLTTITLLLAGLRDAFAREGHSDLAKGTQQLIERPDINNAPQFVLQSETPYPYLQEYIQKFGAPELQANLGKEQEALKAAFQYLGVQIAACLASIDSDPSIAHEKRNEQKRKRLIALRDKALRLQLILIKGVEDQFDIGRASVEFIVISRQYLHLAHLVGVA